MVDIPPIAVTQGPHQMGQWFGSGGLVAKGDHEAEYNYTVFHNDRTVLSGILTHTNFLVSVSPQSSTSISKHGPELFS